MAWLQQLPSGTYHISFRFGGRLFKRSLGTKSEREATARRERLEENIRLVESGRIDLPDDADIPTFLLSDGKLPAKLTLSEPLSLRTLFEGFFASIPDGSLEDSTLNGMQIHRRHLLRELGPNLAVQRLTPADLQAYVNRRSKASGIRGRTLGANTIHKELVTFRTVWGWAVKMRKLKGDFPRDGVRLPKMASRPPFQTWQEIERRIEREQLDEQQQADLWDCLYLNLDEIDKLLAHVHRHALQPWLHPMFVMAAHTGARRSELLRSQVCDIEATDVVIRERKRKRGQHTLRRVPMSPRLRQVMDEWLSRHPGGIYTFCQGAVVRSKSHRMTPQPLTSNEANNRAH